MHTLEVPNNSAFVKTSTAVIGGAVMTFAAFAFMQYLISGEQRALRLLLRSKKRYLIKPRVQSLKSSALHYNLPASPVHWACSHLLCLIAAMALTTHLKRCLTLSIFTTTQLLKPTK